MSGKKSEIFLVWKQISQQLLGAWSLYLHHLNTYIEGSQNDVQHCHSSTTPHATLFRIREYLFFANFQSKEKTKKNSKLFHRCED